jgi:hypothetical protein
MISLFVLVISFILLRGVGWLGVKELSSWREAEDRGHLSGATPGRDVSRQRERDTK